MKKLLLLLLLPVLFFTGNKTFSQELVPAPYYNMTSWDPNTRTSWDSSPYRSFKVTGGTANPAYDMTFRLLWPKGYDSSDVATKYPLILMLHGGGESALGNEQFGVYPVGDPRRFNNDHQLLHHGKEYLNAVNSGKWPGFVLFPQNPYGNWTNNSMLHLDDAVEIINVLVTKLNVDPNRIMISGLSSGALGVWAALSRHRKTFAAAVAYSGITAPVFENTTKVAHIPMWYFQGGRDTNPTPALANNTIQAIRDIGGNPTYSFYPDADHGTWQRAITEPDFFPYMLRYSKLSIFVFYGKTEFQAGEVFKVKLQISPGFDKYEWSYNDKVVGSVIGADYSASIPGSYKVRFMRGTEWSQWSEPVVIKQGPAIRTEPVSVSVALGRPATLTVSASGFPLNYQWQKDGVDIPGATTNRYAITAAKATDNGTYRVIVSNSIGTVISSEAQISVSSPPVIVAQPTTVFSGIGKTATISVVANGTNPLSFQWKKNGVDMEGATSTSLTIENVQITDAGQYSVSISNSFGSVTSSPIELRIIDSPVITTQPSSMTVIEGSTSHFAVVASGEGNLVYQWRRNGDNIAGANGSTYSISNTLATQAGTYSVVVSNEGGSITSQNVTLVVNVPASVLSHPVGASIYTGESASFSVSARGTAPMSYQWQKDGVNISGANSSTLSITNAQLSSAGSYRVVVSNPYGTVFSNTAQLSVTSLPLNGLFYSYYEGEWSALPDFASLTPVKSGIVNNVSLTPRNRSDLFGFQFTGFLEAPVSDNYTLYLNSDDGSKLFINNVEVINNDGLHGALEKSATLFLAKGKHSIRIVYFERGGDEVLTLSWQRAGVTKAFVPSSSLFLENKDAAAIISQPVGANLNTGQSTTLSVVANGANPINYQWQKDNVNIPGATGNSYTITNAQLSDAAGYRAIVSNAYGSATSNTAQVNVTAPAVNGLNYSYYEGVFSALPNFSAMTPVKSGVTNGLDLSPRNREDYFAFQFTGFIDIPVAANYTFYLRSDDGSKLFLNNTQVINNDGDHSALEKAATVSLAKARYAIRVTYYDKTGDQVLTLSWARSGMSKRLVPNSAYFLTNGSSARIAAPDDQAITEEAVSVYPNPSSEKITIGLSSEDGKKTEVSIINQLGKVVKTTLVSPGQSGEGVVVNVRDIEEGAYTLKITNGNKVYYKHIIVGK